MKFENMTVEKFKLLYLQLAHDWLAQSRMNNYVNHALGVDIFSTPSFPCRLEEAEGELIFITGDARITVTEDSAMDAAMTLEKIIHDSEYC